MAADDSPLPSPRIRGALLGGLLGLAIAVTWSVLPGTSGPPAAGPPDSPVRDGPLVLSADPAAPDRIAPRTQSLLFVIQARLRSDDFAGALALADDAASVAERDFLLTNIGDRTLRAFDPNTGTDKTYLEEEGGAARVARALPQMRQVVDALRDAGLKVRYLIRLETAQLFLNRTGPEIAPAAALPKPQPVTPLLEEATKLARGIRSEPPAADGWVFRFPWDRGIFLTAFLSIVGFVASSLAEPFVNAFGTRLVTVVERRVKGAGAAHAPLPGEAAGREPATGHPPAPA